MHIVIVGCGLGGLSCAITCRKFGLNVTILERAPELLPIGAGIQLPPNAAFVLWYLGLDTKLSDYGAVKVDARVLKRYTNGRTLCVRPGGDAMIQDFGMPYHVIHRADYLDMLVKAAVDAGATLRLGAEVVDVSLTGQLTVTLKTGDAVEADIVIGADGKSSKVDAEKFTYVPCPGLWSTMRKLVLKETVEPQETGDLAFRGTFSREQFIALNDPDMTQLMADNKAQLWMGPDRHCSFYPVRSGTRTLAGELDEVRENFRGWDPVIQKMISCMSSVLKWKLMHMQELDRWVNGRIALLGDACHPSLPYQAQGAAMAIEDGCCLGILLGRLAELQSFQENVADILGLYEALRKSRTTMNVQGSINNRKMFHMHDGPDQIARDQELARVDWKSPCAWQWGDIRYVTKLYGFDVVSDTTKAFEDWQRSRTRSEDSKEI